MEKIIRIKYRLMGVLLVVGLLCGLGEVKNVSADTPAPGTGTPAPTFCVTPSPIPGSTSIIPTAIIGTPWGSATPTGTPVVSDNNILVLWDGCGTWGEFDTGDYYLTVYYEGDSFKVPYILHNEYNQSGIEWVDDGNTTITITSNNVGSITCPQGTEWTCEQFDFGVVVSDFGDGQNQTSWFDLSTPSWLSFHLHSEGMQWESYNNGQPYFSTGICNNSTMDCEPTEQQILEDKPFCAETPTPTPTNTPIISAAFSNVSCTGSECVGSPVRIADNYYYQDVLMSWNAYGFGDGYNVSGGMHKITYTILESATVYISVANSDGSAKFKNFNNSLNRAYTEVKINIDGGVQTALIFNLAPWNAQEEWTLNDISELGGQYLWGSYSHNSGNHNFFISHNQEGTNNQAGAYGSIRYYFSTYNTNNIFTPTPTLTPAVTLTPTATVTGTPPPATPTPTSIPVCSTEEPWIEPPIITPIGCYVLVPGGEFELPDNDALPDSLILPGWELCVNGLVIEAKVFEFDMVPYLAATLALILFGYLFRELRS